MEENEENIFSQLLDIQGPNIEFLSSIPLNQLLYLGVDDRVKALTKDDAFWMHWVRKNIFPRHEDSFIKSIPGEMKWKYYSHLYGKIGGSKVYRAMKEGDVARFFPYMELPGIQKVLYINYNYYYLVNGQLMTERRTSTNFYNPDALLKSEQTPDIYIVDFVLVKSTPEKLFIFLLDRDGKLHLQRIALWYYNMILSWQERDDDDALNHILKSRGFLGEYSSRLDRIEAAEYAKSLFTTFDSATEIPLQGRVVAISPKTIVMANGDVHDIKVPMPQGTSISFEITEEPVAEGCVYVGSAGESLITLQTLEECRLTDSFVTKSFRGGKSLRTTTDWTEDGENSTYFYTDSRRAGSGRGIPLNKKLKEAKLSINPAQCAASSDKPIKLHGVRGWYENNAAWTLDGQLFTTANHDGGNGIYTSSVWHSMPGKMLRPAIGIPDFVVQCCHEHLTTAIAIAAPLPRSKALEIALSRLEAAKGIEGLRTLAKLLHYPSFIFGQPISTLKDILAHEPFEIVHKISLVDHIDAYVSQLSDKGADLAHTAKEMSIPRFMAKTKTQLQYAIAEKKLLEERPELRQSTSSVATRGREAAAAFSSTATKKIPNLEDMKVKELQLEARKLKIKGRSRMKKAELLKAIVLALGHK